MWVSIKDRDCLVNTENGCCIEVKPWKYFSEWAVAIGRTKITFKGEKEAREAFKIITKNFVTTEICLEGICEAPDPLSQYMPVAEVIKVGIDGKVPINPPEPPPVDWVARAKDLGVDIGGDGSVKGG